MHRISFLQLMAAVLFFCQLLESWALIFMALIVITQERHRDHNMVSPIYLVLYIRTLKRFGSPAQDCACKRVEALNDNNEVSDYSKGSETSNIIETLCRKCCIAPVYRAIHSWCCFLLCAIPKFLHTISNTFVSQMSRPSVCDVFHWRISVVSRSRIGCAESSS